jgi:hypothetical protein
MKSPSLTGDFIAATMEPPYYAYHILLEPINTKGWLENSNISTEAITDA